MPRRVIAEKPLSSWEEIAGYLGCETRTCMRWEKDSGLPVHRVGSASKSHIFAYQSEFDNWLRGRTDREPLTEPPPQPRPERRFRPRWMIPALVIVLALAAFGLLRGLPRPSQPSDFEVDGSRLVAFDNHGRELWSCETGQTG